MSKPFIELFNLITKKIIKHKKLDNILSTYNKIYYDYNTNKTDYTYILFYISLNNLYIRKLFI